MFDFAALDVAIGLIFVYLVLSLVCSALNETISNVFSWRAKFLREGIANLLDPDNHANGEKLVKELYGHPLVNALIRPVSRKGRARYPSYIPAQTFVAALFDIDVRGTTRELESTIAALPSPQAQKALTALRRSAQGTSRPFSAAPSAGSTTRWSACRGGTAAECSSGCGSWLPVSSARRCAG
ncbi:MAG TPA: hypothetical protein VE289_02700 [Gaiellaceae bacterium]|nr:hypothetical protein [Gaiellaceae bacterium]